MYFYPIRGLRHIFLVLIFGVNWMILTCPGVKSLQCYHCEACETDDSGDIKTCNEKTYDGLPDQGYFACSSELGPDRKLRKDCHWLRNDPDNPGVPIGPRPLRCHTSNIDEVSIDCFCFQNFCNKHRLTPRGKAEPAAPLTPGTIESTAHSIQLQVSHQWMLFSSLGIVLSQRKGLC